MGWAIVPVKFYGYTLVFDALGDAERYRVQSSQNPLRQGRELQFAAAV